MMVLLQSLMAHIITGINSCFGWAEDVFSVFGIVLIILVIVMAVSTFFVRHFFIPLLR